jgi:hypothetical protein
MEEDPSARGPRGSPVVPRCVREPGDAAAVGVHRVDLVVTGPVAGEDDPCAVRRPARLNVFGRIAGEVDPVGLSSRSPSSVMQARIAAEPSALALNKCSRRSHPTVIAAIGSSSISATPLPLDRLRSLRRRAASGKSGLG